MAVALTKEKQKFICEADKKLPESEQTIFWCKPISGRQRAILSDKKRYSADGEKIKFGEREVSLCINFNEIILDTVTLGLVGWENFKYPEGAEVPFSDNKEENLSYISDELIQEIYLFIESISHLQEKQVGN